MMDTSSFINTLYRQCESGISEIRLIHAKNPPIRHFMPLHQPIDQTSLQTQNRAGFDVYIRVAVSQTDASTKTDITAVPALWCDVDDLDPAGYNRLIEHGVSIIVLSGGGYHGYWLLDAPFPVTADNMHHVENTLKGLAQRVGADKKATDITRVLRLPDFQNNKPKYPTPPMCRVIYTDINRLHRFHDLKLKYQIREKLPPVHQSIPESMIENLPRYVQDYLNTGAVKGERNTRLYSCARAYNDRLIPQAQAISDLSPVAIGTGLAESEVMNTIKSAYTHTPQPPINHQTHRTITSRHAVDNYWAGK